MRLRSVQGAEVLIDDHGRPLRVSATEAAIVLEAFCALDENRRYEVVEIIPRRRAPARIWAGWCAAPTSVEVIN